jgi:Amt family ammonium transporter
MQSDRQLLSMGDGKLKTMEVYPARVMTANGLGAFETGKTALMRFIGTFVVLIALPAAAHAQGNAPKIDSGDTAWLLASAALVLLMTPGLALFYGGMVRTKNVLSTIMHSFVAMAIISVIWVLWGYTLAFGPDVGHLIGSLKWFGLNGVGVSPNPDYGPTVPHEAYMIYQMMFAIITPALFSGAIAERIKFKAYVLFMVLWSTLVYCPLAHWVWGAGGWLNNMHALDYAGGTVVHISSGVSALVLALMIGKRRMDERELMRPHNLTMTFIGTALLWFGWFGFNAGSAVAANGHAANAFVVTHIAAATAALVWMLIDWKAYGKPTALGGATGAVAGLVAITPASGFVGPLGAMVIGAGVSCISFWAVGLKNKFGYDDTLDVFGVHGVGGMWGALATGIFAIKIVSTDTYPVGLLAGNPAQLGVQAIGVLTAVVYAAAMTFILGTIVNKIVGLRVEPEDESMGLDQSQHGESGYEMFEAAID